MKDKAEREEQKRNLFRLIESYEEGNIQLAIELMRGSQSLYEAAKRRYYPLLRLVDHSLGKGFKGLLDLAQRIKSPQYNLSFLVGCINHYRDLGDEEALARLLALVPEEQISKVSDVDYLNQVIQLASLPHYKVKEVSFYRKSGGLSIPPNTKLFKHLEKLTLTSPQHLEQFLRVFDTIEALTLLSMNSCGLEELPAQVLRQKTITHLDIRENLLRELPPEFEQMQVLKSLYLCSNRFAQLPDALRRLPKLRNLWCCSGSLQHLPDWLPEMERLDTLHITQNKMKELSPKVFECPNLRTLYAYHNNFSNLMIDVERHSKQLSWLELGHNKFTAFPQKVFLLEQLEYLHLDNCQIINLPDEIGSLKRLKWLDVKQNRIKAIPESVGDLRQLEWIEAGNQPLEKIPESIGNLSKLRGLSLRESNLRHIPDSIQQLQRLEHLDLRRTPIQQHGDLALKLKEWLPKCSVLVGNW